MSVQVVVDEIAGELSAVRDLDVDIDHPGVFHGTLDGAPVRILLVDESVHHLSVERVLQAIVALTPATDHPSAVRILGCQRLSRQRLAVITERHRLGNLETVVNATGAATWSEVQTLGSDIAEALQHAHDAGIVHGHIGPAAVALGTDRHVRLAGHGALGELEHLFGLLPADPFPPPEVARSTAGDLYALGATLLFALSGSFEVDPAVAEPHGDEAVRVLAAVTAPRPADRLESAALLGRILREVRSRPAVGPVEVTARRRHRQRRFSPIALGLMAGIAVVGIALALDLGGTSNRGEAPSTVPAPPTTVAVASVVLPTVPVVSTVTTVAPTSSVPVTTVAPTTVPTTVAVTTTVSTSVAPSTTAPAKGRNASTTTPRTATTSLPAPTTLPPDVERTSD